MATTGDTKLNDLYIKDAGGRNPNPNFPHAGLWTCDLKAVGVIV